MDSNTIGSRIKMLRKSKGVTQDDVADALNVKRQTIQLWENDERDLKTQYTISLADYFGVSCDEILRGVKAENISINKRTGLSDESIATLESAISKNKDYVAIFNELIRNESLLRLCRQILFKLRQFDDLQSFLDKSESIDNELTHIDDFLKIVFSSNTASRAVLFHQLREFQLMGDLRHIIDVTLCNMTNGNMGIDFMKAKTHFVKEKSSNGESS